jgi:hypothetical protein
MKAPPCETAELFSTTFIAHESEKEMIANKLQVLHTIFNRKLSI